MNRFYRLSSLYTGYECLHNVYLVVASDGTVSDILKDDSLHGVVSECTDYRGYIVIPGFIDTHNHGGYGIDFLDANLSEFKYVCSRFAEEGITSLFPSIGAASPEKITNFIRRTVSYVDLSSKQRLRIPEVLGFHLEGPFLNHRFQGLQCEKYLRLPDLELLKTWLQEGGKLFRLLTIAPELPGAMDIICEAVKAGVVCSAGHSNATYEQMKEAVTCGLKQVTHLFNGMRTLHHREPGILGFALTDDHIMAGMCGCDTSSILLPIWQLALTVKGAQRIMLSTDACILKGLPDGEYAIADEKFIYSGGHLILADGSIHPGQPMTFIDSVLNILQNTNANLEELVMMSSFNAAKHFDLRRKGVLLPGYDADFLLLDTNYNLHATYCRGEIVYESQ